MDTPNPSQPTGPTPAKNDFFQKEKTNIIVWVIAVVVAIITGIQLLTR